MSGDLPELPEDLQAEIDGFSFEDLFKSSNPNLDNTGNPRDEEWERVRAYREGVEFTWNEMVRALPEEERPAALREYDQMAENFLSQFRSMYGIDTRNLRTLWSLTLGSAIQFWFVYRDTVANCGASEQIKQHGLMHLRNGSLLFDYVLRIALVSAGAPSVKPIEPDQIPEGYSFE